MTTHFQPLGKVLLFAAFLLPLTGIGLELPSLPGLVTRIRAKPINESSGLCPSVRHPGVFWTHNDSGDGPNLYAIHLDGRLVATYTVQGAKARDWEDIAIDEHGMLYIADVGNNRHKRNDLKIYKVPEPETLQKTGQLKVVDTTPVNYPDGAYNCEALFLDEQGTPTLITKDPGPAKVYSLEEERWVLRQQLDVPDVVTGADLSDDGRLAVSTYLGFVVFQRDSDHQWVPAHRTFAILEQCEAVCWHNGALLLTSEQRALFRFTPDKTDSQVSAFKRHNWNPNDPERTYVPVNEQQKQTETILLRFQPNSEHTTLRLHAPWKNHSGRAVFLFSSKPPGERAKPSSGDFQLEINSRSRNPTLRTRQFGKPGRPLTNVKIPVQLKKADANTLELHIDNQWLDSQIAFGAYTFGFNEEPVGWPYSYYRINKHPLLWGERSTRSQTTDNPVKIETPQ
ncbi:MAG: hypothetical protein ACOCWJ_05510 [Verrucomicrobiota bacterium]